MNKVSKKHHQTFESIRKQGEGSAEYWSARDLQPILEYAQWRSLDDIIKKAKIACRNSGQAVENHFAEVRKMVTRSQGQSAWIRDERVEAEVEERAGGQQPS